ncbi:MAG: Do family serine endopeptidase [Proteobacteria bacterium]|nr:Do family serine endopeptidase [Pseudomonadota bacterium]
MQYCNQRLKIAALVLGLSTLFAPGALGQGLEVGKARVPGSRAEITQSFAPVVKVAAPAVVNVYASQKAPKVRNPFEGDPFFERFFGGMAQPERARQSVGSGVIVSKDGMVVTNHHVIEGMSEIKVALADRREFEAEVKLRDPKTDLAVLKIKSNGDFPVLEMGDSERLEVGDLVLAIGNPFGVGQTVTQGIVSALARTHVGVSDYQFFIQTDAAINPGNSGGALVDTNGRLIGINTAIFSQSGGSHGIGFAIPVTMVKAVVESAKTGESVRRPWLGATLQNITPDLAETLNLKRPIGALVTNTVAGGAAEKAGLHKLDVVTAVDGVEIEDPDAFGYRFATKTVGGTAKLAVLRGGKPIEIALPLMAAPEVPAKAALVVKTESPFQGATLWNISPAVKDELSLQNADAGVVVADVAAGSSAAEVGFRKGDILLAINGVAIESTAGFEKANKPKAYVWRVRINRGGQILNSIFGG